MSEVAPASAALVGTSSIHRKASLRDAVLAGLFFGPQSGQAAREHAAFIGGPSPELADWFGCDQPLATDPGRLRGLLDRDIAALDALISVQLDAVLHAARLRRLEGMWRGLSWLLGEIDPAARVRVRLLNVSWLEIVRDLERAVEFDQSQLFGRIYDDEFGTPGGEPFGLLIIDHEVRHRSDPQAPSDDTAAITQLAAVSAAAFSPVLLSASPVLLDVGEWADLAMLADPASPLADPAHARWRRLGQNEDMRFVGVALPRLLARCPWADDPARGDGFRYAEHAPDAASRVWMSAIYAFAANAVRAFCTHGWPADIRGVDLDREGGGVVTALPSEGYSTERDHGWLRAPLDIVFGDRQERSLIEQGLMPLTALPYTGDAAFVALRSLQVPGRYGGRNAEAAAANARISAQFNAMLCVSRFAHYVKIIGRRMTGDNKTEDEIQRTLREWLSRYINTNTNAGPESRARAPLLAGEVTVQEEAGRPGCYGCSFMLQPHFQLDDVSASFRFKTDIKAPGRAA
nr:type VI secretion system contractile sheath large subunit [uncultured Lichenicoccus sp.]